MNDATPLLPLRDLADVVQQAPARLDDAVLDGAGAILDRVRSGGRAAVLELRAELDGIDATTPLVVDRDELHQALDTVDKDSRKRLVRMADRIRSFAEQQRRALGDELTVERPGYRCGHEWQAVDRAGCYAPGGRHPLPSSILMTALAARAAGVGHVEVACPRDDRWVRAAAAAADADRLWVVGGAQAIGVLAYGLDGDDSDTGGADVVVGPGNRWVTAAKWLVSRDVGIDALAGPSEVAVVSDAQANPAAIAAELIAQAEHGDDAGIVWITIGEDTIDGTRAELQRQLDDLGTASTARLSLAAGATLVADSRDHAVEIVNRVATEHLQLQLSDAASFRGRIRHAGGIFEGATTPVALGDYGAGPNHTLPTAGAARHRAGLSVLDFLRPRTWLAVDDAAAATELYEDTAWLARIEGLEGHARAAERASSTSADDDTASGT